MKVDGNVSKMDWCKLVVCKRQERINLSSPEIPYPDLYQVTHFMECSTMKKWQNRSSHRSFINNEGQKVGPYIFFTLHRELLGKFGVG